LGHAKPCCAWLQGGTSAAARRWWRPSRTQAVKRCWPAGCAHEPTELLADQHAQNFKRWFNTLGRPVALLHRPARGQGAHRGARRNSRVRDNAAYRDRHPCPVQGSGIRSARRVMRRRTASVRGASGASACARRAGATDTEPHQLIMRPTPIPRTLADGLCDLDVSIIDSCRPRRTPVKTVVLTGYTPRRGGQASHGGVWRCRQELPGVPAHR